MALDGGDSGTDSDVVLVQSERDGLEEGRREVGVVTEDLEAREGRARRSVRVRAVSRGGVRGPAVEKGSLKEVAEMVEESEEGPSDDEDDDEDGGEQGGPGSEGPETSSSWEGEGEGRSDGGESSE